MSLYDKSRMIGDNHVRFCERNGVKLPVPTRQRIAFSELRFRAAALGGIEILLDLN